MDGADVGPGWSLVRGYFSPATLFLLLNVVIGTIALTSRSHRRRHYGDDEHHQLQRQQQQQGYNDQYAPPPPPAPLARTSSVMERLRSLGLYRFRSGDFPPEYNYNLSAASTVGDDEHSKQQQAQYTRSRSEPAARPPVDRTGNREEKAAKAKVAKKPISEVKRLERAPAPVSEAKRLERAPAPVSEAKRLERAPVPVQGRVVQRAPPRAPARAAAVAAKEEIAAAGAPEAAAVCVDARADDFINKFRQQLQLQRLNSLLNYKEMLNRGT